MAETAAYIDMIGGVSGDMLLGAMVGVGLELEELQVELDKLPDRGYRLVETRVIRGGLEAVLVVVELDEDGGRKRTWDDFYSSIDNSTLEESDRRLIRQIFDVLAEAVIHAPRIQGYQCTDESLDVRLCVRLGRGCPQGSVLFVSVQVHLATHG